MARSKKRELHGICASRHNQSSTLEQPSVDEGIAAQTDSQTNQAKASSKRHGGGKAKRQNTRNVYEKKLNPSDSVAQIETWKKRAGTRIQCLLEEEYKDEFSTRTALVHYLSRRENKRLLQAVIDEVATEDGGKKLRDVHIQEAVTEIEEHWSDMLGLAVQTRCKLSRRKYQYLIFQLSRHWTKAKGWKKRKFTDSDVQFPTLGKNASEKKVKQLKQDIFDGYDPKQSKDGKQVEISLQAHLQSVLSRRTTHADPMYRLTQGDGHTLYRGCKCTDLAVSLTPTIGAPREQLEDVALVETSLSA